MRSSPRSVLYVPASQRRFLDRIPSLAADTVIVDLEDGVAPAEKGAARDNVRHAASDGALAGRPWSLRINTGPGGPPPEDLTLVGFARPSTVVLPKASDPEGVKALAARFAEHGASTALMIETAEGVSRVQELAGAHPAVRMLIVGSADLRLSLGARPDSERTWEIHALSQVLLAARRHGAAAIDAAYFAYRDASGLRKHAAVARNLGYDGKSCIHPAQVDPIHEIFGNTAAEIAWARRVLAAWDEGRGESVGVVALDGEMIEALHVTVARRLLES